jgi:transcriptional regulator with XRE-family HTH domain
MTEKEVRDILRQRARELGTRVALAKELGISTPYLSDILNGNRAPGTKILKALGIRKSYERVA